ncbi:MAG: thermonuclease family protein, partial [Methylocystis sp.]|nr:thermonuclease family protein [Methylocystis sp.]
MHRFVSPLVAVLSASITLSPSTSHAQDQWLPFPPNAVFETGDTWVANGQRFRLYGVQSCLRGTFFTNVQGGRVDCGESSVALLTAMVRDLKPFCNVSARSGDLAYVVCVTNVTVQGRVTRLDLATALITAGCSFAAFNPGGRPVHEPYLVAQVAAQQAKRGFHAFTDVPDPNLILLRALRSQAPATPAA